MYAHFEDSGRPTRCDCPVHSLSWMGQVPEGLVGSDRGWTLGRMNYYRDGWLATGNAKGIVGVTFTSCANSQGIQTPGRTNFNLRGHRSEVS